MRAATCAIIVAALGGLRGGDDDLDQELPRAPGCPARGPDAARDGGAREGRSRFMAQSGVLLGALFTGAVVLSAVAVLLLPLCW